MPRKKAVVAEAPDVEAQATTAPAPEPTARNIYEAIYNIQKAFRAQPPPQGSFEELMGALEPLLEANQVVCLKTHPYLAHGELTFAHIPTETCVYSSWDDQDDQISVILALFGIYVELKNNEVYVTPVPAPFPDSAQQEVEAPAEIPPQQEPEVIEPEVIIKPVNPGLGRGKTLDLQCLDVSILLKMISAAETTQQLALVVDGAVDGEAWIDLEDREKFISEVRSRYATLARLANSGGRIPAFEKKMKDHVAKLEEDKHEDAEMKKWDAEIEEEAKKNSEAK